MLTSRLDRCRTSVNS